ncbi:MAG: PepSY-associated TM helix domain-containing protein [Yoonia sp.]|uniref:PepSY-associated TM helix domain-containing protein n=1 Tax=Yoonia sp. TaxID=2212373 RepID=UPI003EF2D796
MRFVRQIHKWFGAILALFLIVIAMSGTALIWKDVYLRLVFAQPVQTIDVETVTYIALAAERAFGIEGINTASLNASAHLARLSLVDGKAAYMALDGAVLDIWEENGRPEDWLLDLHHRFLSGTRGLYVAGTVGLTALGLIFLGLISYWPARRGWRHGLVPRGTARPSLRAAHRNSGAVLAAPLFILIFAGVVLTFPATARAIFLWGSDPDIYGEAFADGVDDLEGRDEATWPRAILRAAKVFPDGEITGLVWPIGGNERQILIRDAGEWNTSGNSSVQITVPDGYMDLRIAAAELPVGARAYNLMAPLHRSELGGWIYKILQSMLGLGLVWLGGLGLTSFVRSFWQP